MNNLNRKRFLKQLSLLAAGTLLAPKPLLALQSSKEDLPMCTPLRAGDPAIKVRDLSIVDLHCHPSLKMYLWGRDLRRHHHPGKGDNDFNQQIDIHTLEPGYVRGMLATHYLVEASVETSWSGFKLIFEGIKTFFPRLQDKVEHEDYSNFTQINVMIDTLESQVHLANQYFGTETFVIARSFQEFEAAIDVGKIPLAHSIEGAHALGRNFPLGFRKPTNYLPVQGKMQNGPDPAFHYIRNLEALKQRGVCLITLAHLFNNDIAFPCEGIAVNEKHYLGMKWKFRMYTDNTGDSNNLSLTPIGEEVVKKMLDIGMIVDLTHSTPAARKRVFAINNAREKKRPLTFTHVGSQVMFDKYDNKYNDGNNKSYGYYSVSPDEIKEICACDGVIGVVFENFWLTGCDTHLGATERKKFKYVIPYIIEAIIDINSYTDRKDFYNLAIGSDFDGLADAGEDMYTPSQLGDLVNAMKSYEGHNFTDDEIRMIFHDNAMRLLREGWT